MILDTSAVLAVLFAEEDAALYARQIQDNEDCKISAATFVELSIVLESNLGDGGIRNCDAFFRGNDIAIISFTEEHALLAREAFSMYGKKRHAAGLNLGDCFSYALAKATGEPLLFKGKDFSKTDIQSALE